MSRKRLLAALIALFCEAAPPARAADSSIKKLVIEDCGQALVKISELAPDKQAELLPYLGLVLRLQTHDPLAGAIDTSAFVKRPGFSAPYGEFQEMEAWKSLNTGREMEARKCAGEALRLLAPMSFSVIPDLLEVVQQRILPEDVKELLGEVTISIASKAVATPGFVFDPVVLRKIASLADSEVRHYVENVLIELKDLSFPYLLEEMKKPDPIHRDRITQMILFLDPREKQMGEGIVGLLGSGDDGLRQRTLDLLAGMPQFAELALPHVVNRLGDLSPEVQERAVTALEKLAGHLPRSAVPGESAQKLYDAFTGGEGKRRDRLLQVLVSLSGFLPDFPAKVRAWIEGGDGDLRRRALRMAGMLKPMSPELFDLLVKHAQSSVDPGTQDQAIEGLAHEKSKRSAVLDIYTRILKSTASLKDTNRRMQILGKVADALVEIEPGKEGSKLVSYFVDSLLTVPASREVLNAMGREVEPRIVPLLKNSNPVLREIAAGLIGDFRSVTSASHQSLVGLLKDESPQVRKVAQASLIKIGSAVVPPLVKILGQKGAPIEQRRAAARVVAQIDPKLIVAIPALVEGARSAECSGKAEYIALIAKIQKGASPQLASMLLACLKAAPSGQVDMVDALADIGPLIGNERDELIATLSNTSFNKQARIRALDRWRSLGIPLDEILALLKPMLRENDNSVRYFAITLVNSLGSEGLPLVPDLVSLKDDGGLEPLLRHEAALAAVAIDPKSFDFGSFLLGELQSDQKQWAERSLRRLGAGMALPILSRALNELPPDQLAPVAQSAGEFGKEASGLAPQLVPLLSSKFSGVRFAGLVALLRVKPETPEVLPNLRRELLTERRNELLGEELNVLAKAPFEAIKNAPSNRVEAFIAERILSSL